MIGLETVMEKLHVIGQIGAVSTTVHREEIFDLSNQMTVCITEVKIISDHILSFIVDQGHHFVSVCLKITGMKMRLLCKDDSTICQEMRMINGMMEE